MQDKYHPIRDPQHRNYLPFSAYPLDTLPPFALGNFYLLSGDLASYLARNAAVLKPVGTLEDLSVGVWMMGLQVENDNFFPTLVRTYLSIFKLFSYGDRCFPFI